MRIARRTARAPMPGCVLTIGNFDGVHRGHQAIIARLRQLADEHQVEARLLTFEPHPVEVLAPERAPPRLLRFREKMARLQRHGIERVSCLRFDAALARCEPDRFVRSVLVEGLRVRHLLVGDDFRFGHRGAGDFETLERASRRLGFGLSRIETFALDGARVSSTRVREALAGGDLDAAEALLGWRYGVCGRVRRGRQLGRAIGFPTANIAPGRNRFAPAGVFAVSVLERSGRRSEGVANVGRRPTVDGVEERLEVHLFDRDEDLYGRELQVIFEHAIRGERRFAGLDELRAQIARDAEAARAHFARSGTAACR